MKKKILITFLIIVVGIGLLYYINIMVIKQVASKMYTDSIVYFV